MVGQLNNYVVRALREQFEYRCLSLVIEAYQDAYLNKRVQLNFDEEDITEVLNNCLDDNPKRIEWQISTNTENRLRSPKISIAKGFAKKSARIDLRFTTISSSLDYRYYMEAKNLKSKNSALKRRYIATGIDNYISNKYNDGFLVGYVLQGNVADNIKGLNTLLISDKRDSEIITFGAKADNFDHYMSAHLSIRIKHLFFDFN